MLFKMGTVPLHCTLRSNVILRLTVEYKYISASMKRVDSIVKISNNPLVHAPNLQTETEEASTDHIV